MDEARKQGLYRLLDAPISMGYLPSAEDTSTWTVMSYSDSPAQYHLAYSPLDIAALQYLYGPSPTARAGADTYLISASTSNFIWDGAGVDTVSAEGLSIGVTLYLEPGYWGFARASGDFDGDGKSDILLQNVDTGGCYIWQMNGLALKDKGSGEIAWKPGKDWVARATGDFDGDGKSDILLQNVDTGGCYIWEMNGLALKDGGSGEIAWKPGKEWVARATGDFDGDGKSDILLQSIDTGGCYIWEMNGLALKDGGSGEIAWKPGKEWVVQATGDYNGDGKSDILLQDVDTGGCYIWEMNGLALKDGSSGEIGWKPGADWHAVA